MIGKSPQSGGPGLWYDFFIKIQPDYPEKVSSSVKKIQFPNCQDRVDYYVDCCPFNINRAKCGQWLKWSPIRLANGEHIHALKLLPGTLLRKDSPETILDAPILTTVLSHHDEKSAEMDKKQSQKDEMIRQQAEEIHSLKHYVSDIERQLHSLISDYQEPKKNYSDVAATTWCHPNSSSRASQHGNQQVRGGRSGKRKYQNVVHTTSQLTPYMRPVNQQPQLQEKQLQKQVQQQLQQQIQQQQQQQQQIRSMYQPPAEHILETLQQLIQSVGLTYNSRLQPLTNGTLLFDHNC